MLRNVEDMAQVLAVERDRNSYSKKLYKAQADEHKGATLQTDITNRVEALKEISKRERVDFSSLEAVQGRTFEYFNACAEAGVYPSVMGLAVHGYGISRQALNQFLLRNAGSKTAEFINMAKDIMADILTNASLYNNANAVQVIFQLKNHFGHTDRVEIQPVAADICKPALSIDEVEAKYAELPDD